jgi:hypothetical protein
MHLEGDALAVFEKIELDMAVQSDETFVQALQALVTHVFPNNALSNQKSWLRRNEAAWKKKDVVTRTWVARLHKINEMLVEFPPNLNANQKLADDEFMEVLEYGVLPHWKAAMVKMDFLLVTIPFRSLRNSAKNSSTLSSYSAVPRMGTVRARSQSWAKKAVITIRSP